MPPHVGQPTVNLHATRTEVRLGEPVRLQLSVVNSIARPVMTLKLILQVPSGWSMSGTGFAGSCTGQCTATYDVASCDQRAIDIEMQPNQSGSFTVESQMEWWFGNDLSTLDGKEVSLPLTVIDGGMARGGGVPTAVVAPTSPPPAPPVIPASEGGGCNSMVESSRTGNLTMMGLLVIPALRLIGRSIRVPIARRRLPGMCPLPGTKSVRSTRLFSKRWPAGLFNANRN